MKILIIDDEFVSRMKLQRILTQYGECHTVANGEEALLAFTQAHERNEPYQLITIDIRLPDMSGQEIIHQIRDWEHQNDAPFNDLDCKILMVSAMKDSKNIMASFKNGCEGYIVKPFDFKSVSTELEKLEFHN